MPSNSSGLLTGSGRCEAMTMLPMQERIPAAKHRMWRGFVQDPAAIIG
jgi:hypothetical protein